MNIISQLDDNLVRRLFDVECIKTFMQALEYTDTAEASKLEPIYCAESSGTRLVPLFKVGRTCTTGSTSRKLGLSNGLLISLVRNKF